MVEAMYENSHDYFRQFKKQFQFYTTPTKPCLSSQEISYIIGYHPSSSVIPFCSLSYNHYHVLCEILPSDKNSQKSNVPCLVNCFFHLFRSLSGLIVVGTLAAKLQSCVSIIFQLNSTTHQSKSQSSLNTKSLSNSDKKGYVLEPGNDAVTPHYNRQFPVQLWTELRKFYRVPLQ